MNDNSNELARALEALHAIDPNTPRSDWVRAGMAAQAAGLSLDDFDAWSSSGATYNQRDTRDTWRSFRPDGGIGAGTLFTMAREHGWQGGNGHAAPSAPQRTQQRPRGLIRLPTDKRLLPIFARSDQAKATHPYIIAKGANWCLDGLRQLPRDDLLFIRREPMAGALVVPVFDAAGRVQGLQLIRHDGLKLNAPGSRLGGGAFIVGVVRDGQPLYVCEGLATAQASWIAGDGAACCTFGAANMEAVAERLVGQYPGAVLVLVPDAGKEDAAHAIAARLGAKVAAMPPGSPANFDACDLMQRDGREGLAALLTASIHQPHAADAAAIITNDGHAIDEADAAARFTEQHGVVFEHQGRQINSFALPSPIDEAEWTAAKLAPRCIVEGYLYADVAQMVGIGGAAKTTLAIFEAVHIVLGRPLYGRAVVNPGPVLIVSAEDSRAQIIARAREIMIAMRLDVAQIAKVRDQLRIADLTGGVRKLAQAEGNMVLPSSLAGEICDVAASLAPVLVIFDPQISFGAAEHMVNANEQALVEAGRIIRSRLNCCVRYLHHTGKLSGREATVDAYSGRGGTAMPDGCRMVTIVQRLKPDEFRKLTGQALRRGQTGLRLTQAKNSYLIEQPPFFVVREHWAFDVITAPENTPEGPSREAIAAQVWNLLSSEHAQGRLHGRRSLFEACGESARLTKLQMDGAIAMLVADGRVEERQRARMGRGGGGKYLHPVSDAERAANAVQAKGARP